VLAYYRLHNDVDLNGEAMPVEVLVEEDANGLLHYDFLIENDVAKAKAVLDSSDTASAPRSIQSHKDWDRGNETVTVAGAEVKPDAAGLLDSAGGNMVLNLFLPDEGDGASDLAGAAAVDAAYQFASATAAFKEWVADSIAEASYSPFATSKAMDDAAKAAGLAIAWDLVTETLLDATDDPKEGVGFAQQLDAEDEQDDTDPEAEWEATPDGEDENVRDGDFAGHPFRGNQYREASRASGSAVESSMRAKHAERKGDTRSKPGRTGQPTTPIARRPRTPLRCLLLHPPRRDSPRTMHRRCRGYRWRAADGAFEYKLNAYALGHSLIPSWQKRIAAGNGQETSLARRSDGGPATPALDSIVPGYGDNRGIVVLAAIPAWQKRIAEGQPQETSLGRFGDGGAAEPTLDSIVRGYEDGCNIVILAVRDCDAPLKSLLQPQESGGVAEIPPGRSGKLAARDVRSVLHRALTDKPLPDLGDGPLLPRLARPICIPTRRARPQQAGACSMGRSTPR
jgi:hypothetical protein